MINKQTKKDTKEKKQRTRELVFPMFRQSSRFTPKKEGLAVRNVGKTNSLAAIPFSNSLLFFFYFSL